MRQRWTGPTSPPGYPPLTGQSTSVYPRSLSRVGGRRPPRLGGRLSLPVTTGRRGCRLKGRNRARTATTGRVTSESRARPSRLRSALVSIGHPPLPHPLCRFAMAVSLLGLLDGEVADMLKQSINTPTGGGPNGIRTRVYGPPRAN